MPSFLELDEDAIPFHLRGVARTANGFRPLPASSRNGIGPDVVQDFPSVWLAPLDKAAKAVLLAYADHVLRDGTGGWPSTARVAQMTSYSERWIYEQPKILQSLGVLVMTKPSTPTKPAVYRIDIDALQRLIDGAEAGSPPELTSARPTGSQFRPPLNPVPPPPEPNAPKPPTEPSVEPPQGEVEAQIDAEVKQIINKKVNRGEPINNLPAFEATVRRNVEPKVTERIETQKATAVGLDTIASCV